LSLNSKTGSIQPKDGEAVKPERFEEVSKEFGFAAVPPPVRKASGFPEAR